MPAMARILGDIMKYYEIDDGKIDSNKAVPYIAMGSFYIEDIGRFKDSVSANREFLNSDIPKYTNKKPIIQTLKTNIL